MAANSDRISLFKRSGIYYVTYFPMASAVGKAQVFRPNLKH
jgi:hypothetical protein